MQDELDYFFKAVHQPEVAERTVTKRGFFQARRKVKPEAFIHLNHQRWFADNRFLGVRPRACQASSGEN